jgi:excisionase family DNA binding protein
MKSVSSSVMLNLSVDGAATALGVSPRTVRTLIARGELPTIRIGRRVLLPCGALEEWIRARTDPPR